MTRDRENTTPHPAGVPAYCPDCDSALCECTSVEAVEDAEYKIETCTVCGWRLLPNGCHPEGALCPPDPELHR